MISQRPIISGSAGPIFALFSPNESVLAASDRSGSLFPIPVSRGTLPCQPILWKKWQLPTFAVLAFRNGMGYHYLNVRINSTNDVFISCKNFVKFSSVTQNWQSSFVNVWYDMAKKLAYLVEYLRIYLTDFHNLFTIWKRALHADDGSEPYFPICQGTLPWQPNNVERNEKIMKADWYHVHFLHCVWKWIGILLSLSRCALTAEMIRLHLI